MNLLAGFFKNGDGLLCWKLELTDNRGFKDKYVRVLYTDSGHYLLPIDRFDLMDDNSE